MKSLPMTINDRSRNLAQAGRALHAPAEARRAFRDLARAEAAKPPECRPGQQGVGRVLIENLAAVLFGSGFRLRLAEAGAFHDDVFEFAFEFKGSGIMIAQVTCQSIW